MATDNTISEISDGPWTKAELHRLHKRAVSAMMTAGDYAGAARALAQMAAVMKGEKREDTTEYDYDD